MKVKQLISLLLSLSIMLSCMSTGVFAASGITAVGVDDGDGTGSITLTDTPARGVEMLYILSLDGITQTVDPQSYTGPIDLPSPGEWELTYNYSDKSAGDPSDTYMQVVAEPEGAPAAAAAFVPIAPFAAAPSVSQSYDWKTDKVTLTGASGTFYNITNKATLSPSEVKTLQTGSTSYSSAFTLNSSAAMMYVYVWPTQDEADTNNYTKLSINVQPPIPQVSADYNSAGKTISLTDDAATGGPLYYVVSATDPGNTMPDPATAVSYVTPANAKAGNFNYVTVWHSMVDAFKDLGVTLKVQTNAPKPAVTIDVNDSTKEITIGEPTASGLPLYYWYDDGVSGLTTPADQQAAAVEYTGTFNIDASFADREIRVWTSQDAAYAANYTSLMYYRDQDPPETGISFDLTYDGSVYKLNIDGAAALPYKLYYTVKENGGETSEVRDYTAPISLQKDKTYVIESFYSNNAGVSRTDSTTYNITIDADGNFDTLNPDKKLNIVARGSYIYITGPSSTCEYEVCVFNPDTKANYTTFTEPGPFEEKEVKLPNGATKYQIEYTVKEDGKLKAVNKGIPVTVDATYMPEPFNLKWNSVTMVATAEISKPANVLEFELYNTDYNTSYQKNTTGEFTNVPSGRYELRAVAYNSENEEFRSTTTKINLTIDKDPPALSLVPITMAGSLPGAIITATDLGSGINRIEVSINGMQQPNVASGTTVYAITEGDNAIKVIAYDNMGNEKAETVTIEFDKSLLNPVIELTDDTPDEDGAPREWWNTGVSVSVSAANAATKLQYLTLSNGSRMLHMETKNPAEDAISFTYDLDTDGEYNLVAQALSPGGIQSGSDEKRTVKIDTTAPDKPDITVGDDGYLTITSKDIGSGIDYIRYQIAGKPEEEYTEGVLVTGDGEVAIMAVAYDKAGNASEANSIKAEVYTEKPTAPELNGVGSSWIVTEEPVIVTITPGTNKSSEKNKVTTRYLIGTETRDSGWQSYKEGEELEFTEEGIHKISAYSEDENGNVSEVVVGYVKIDYSSPSLRGIATSPFDSAVNRTSFRLYFDDNGGSGIDKIFVGIDGKEKRLDLTAKHRSQGYATMTLQLPPVNPEQIEASTDNGELDETTFIPEAHVVYFRALDKAGNESKIELVSDYPGNPANAGSTTDTIGKPNPTTGGN